DYYCSLYAGRNTFIF
nr:immunoglobulin light chain junction region [Macaca mulatta]